jgi:hypothetical protein
MRDGLLCGACHRARVRATDWLAMTAGKAYCPLALCSNALSTASVIAVTPVSIVGFGTGANWGE